MLLKGQVAAIGQLLSVWRSVPRSLKYCIRCMLGSQRARHAKKPSLSGKSVCVYTRVYKGVYGCFATEKPEVQTKRN